MNIFLSCDIEGCCGVSAWSETEPGKPDGNYEAACRQMSLEVGAACRAAVQAGGDRILVKDAHDQGRNIDPEYLPETVRINRGWSGDPECMVSGIQNGEWDAAVFTGYHAAAGCGGNPLCHTMNPCVDYVEINGERASEFTINAYTAGYYGVPVCFISGDAAVCEQARRMIPSIAAVPVSRGIGDSSTCLHPALAVKRIEETLMEQLDSGMYENCIVPMPPKFEIVIRYKEHRDAYKFSFYPGVEKLNDKTLSFTCVDYRDALCLFQFVL